MSDITKIMELRSKDGGDWEEWPYPTITVTSRVTGDLKASILAKLQIASGEVTIEESNISAGYSEFTQDNDYEIRVMVDGVKQWENTTYLPSSKSGMDAFLKAFPLGPEP